MKIKQSSMKMVTVFENNSNQLVIHFFSKFSKTRHFLTACNPIIVPDGHVN